MEFTTLLFLSSGLFLGWSLGANDAANIFGTAVGTKMLKFTTAAIIGSIFVILGAIISGEGAAHTLGKLGEVNAIGGAFTTASSAALTVYWMTKARLPVSTSQAIVGAIVGWNIFAGVDTDSATLTTILLTWVLCPVLAAITATLLYQLTTWVLRRTKPHLLTLDWVTRLGLILAGAFGAYSLGANNIANVMGVFIPSITFSEINVGILSLNSVQQLFLIGSVAIAIGIVTYSKRVMLTVGQSLMPLTPVAAWVVVMAHSIVLFLFSSEGLELFLASHSLPTVPLVPVSSSQAVVGAVIGVGLLKGGSQIDWGVALRITSGWATTPIIAGIMSVFFLYIVQNVFLQTVQIPINYKVSHAVVEKLESEGIPTASLIQFEDVLFPSAGAFNSGVGEKIHLSPEQLDRVLHLSKLQSAHIDSTKIDSQLRDALSTAQLLALHQLNGRKYVHSWQLEGELADLEPEWRLKEGTIINKAHNREVRSELALIERVFAVTKIAGATE